MIIWFDISKIFRETIFQRFLVLFCGCQLAWPFILLKINLFGHKCCILSDKYLSLLKSKNYCLFAASYCLKSIQAALHKRNVRQQSFARQSLHIVQAGHVESPHCYNSYINQDPSYLINHCPVLQAISRENWRRKKSLSRQLGKKLRKKRKPQVLFQI